MQAIECPEGVRGFDANCIILMSVADAFATAGYRFAVRYVRRVTRRSTDLSAVEVQVLAEAGLAVMAVQHVESESSWEPSAEKGLEYGANAATAAQECTLEPGTCVWLDLEGVDLSVGADEIIAFAQNWCAPVAGAGLLPGLYVGWHSGLTADQLYALPFTRYWSSYNLNSDEEPATRGVCMKQHVRRPLLTPPGVTIDFDCDTAFDDALGGRAVVTAPDGWLESL